MLLSFFLRFEAGGPACSNFVASTVGSRSQSSASSRALDLLAICLLGAAVVFWGARALGRPTTKDFVLRRTRFSSRGLSTKS